MKAEEITLKEVRIFMKFTVIGPGRWGSFIAWYIDRLGHEVTLYGRASSDSFRETQKTRQSGVVTFPPSIRLSTDLSACSFADVIVISINSQGLRALFDELASLELRNKTFLLCMKGLEVPSGKRLSEIAREKLDPSCSVAVWLGPGHVEEFTRGQPNCMVIDSDEPQTTARLIDVLGSDLIRFYYGDDLIGNEIGAAAKNVIGIAAGMLDGYGLSSLKGPMMSRATREIGRLISAMGGSELSVYGLCHLGDYEASVFSKHSHNRRFGECFVKGEKFEALAEGVFTVRALTALAAREGVDLPICGTVHDILYADAEPKAALERLFARTQKKEFYE